LHQVGTSFLLIYMMHGHTYIKGHPLIYVDHLLLYYRCTWGPNAGSEGDSIIIICVLPYIWQLIIPYYLYFLCTRLLQIPGF